MVRAYSHQLRLSDEEIEVLREIQSYIIKHLGIQISLNDTYLFWTDISEDWCAGCLCIDDYYDESTRYVFLLDELEGRGIIYEE